MPPPRDGSDIYSPENVAPTNRLLITQSVTNSVISKSVLKQKEDKFLFITFLWFCGVFMNTLLCFRNGFMSVRPSLLECNARGNCIAKIWQFASLVVASIDPLVGIIALVGYLYVRISRNMHAITFGISDSHSTCLAVLLTRDALASINIDN